MISDLMVRRTHLKNAIPNVTCILGMHRSGTSCLAGCLKELGLRLGDVVEPAPHNLKGGQENIELRAINDQVLAESGGAWDRPPEKLVLSEASRRRCSVAVEAFHKFGDWGFKDPRTLLTLPIWLDEVERIRFVATFRHPLAAAHSLAAREGLSVEEGLVLWKTYNLKLLSYLEHYEFPLVCFDWRANKYVCVVVGIAQALGLATHNSRDGIAFFDESLKHQDWEILDHPLPSDIVAIHRQLVASSDHTRRQCARAREKADKALEEP